MLRQLSGDKAHSQRESQVARVVGTERVERNPHQQPDRLVARLRGAGEDLLLGRLGLAQCAQKRLFLVVQPAEQLTLGAQLLADGGPQGLRLGLLHAGSVQGHGRRGVQVAQLREHTCGAQIGLEGGGGELAARLALTGERLARGQRMQTIQQRFDELASQRPVGSGAANGIAACVDLRRLCAQRRDLEKHLLEDRFHQLPLELRVLHREIAYRPRPRVAASGLRKSPVRIGALAGCRRLQQELGPRLRTLQTSPCQVALQLQNALLGREISRLRAKPLELGLQRHDAGARGELLRLRLRAAAIRTGQSQGLSSELVEGLARFILFLGERVRPIDRQVPLGLEPVDLQLRLVVVGSCRRFQMLEIVVAERREVGQRAWCRPRSSPPASSSFARRRRSSGAARKASRSRAVSSRVRPARSTSAIAR